MQFPTQRLVLASILLACSIGLSACGDQATLEHCIGGMRDAAKGQSLYGEFEQQLRELKDAQDVKIVSEQALGSSGVAYEYQVDGQARTIMCGR